MSKEWHRKGFPWFLSLKLQKPEQLQSNEKTPSITHKRIWEISRSEHLKVSTLGKQRMKKGRGAETGATDAAWISLWNLEIGVESSCGVHSVALNISAWVISTYYAGGTHWSEQRQNTEGRQLCSINCHCQTEGWVMEPGHLPHSQS